jgi:hypothetical protein
MVLIAKYREANRSLLMPSPKRMLRMMTRSSSLDEREDFTQDPTKSFRSTNNFSRTRRKQMLEYVYNAARPGAWLGMHVKRRSTPPSYWSRSSSTCPGVRFWRMPP